MPPLPSRRRQRRRPRGRTFHVDVFHHYWPALVEKRKGNYWVEDLPLDVLSNILGRLGPVELLTGGAARVCRIWRRAVRHDPALWRCIDMRGCSRELRLNHLAREAVRRSAGLCESFWGEYFGDDDFLLFLAEQAPSLRSLRLVFFPKVTNEGFAEAISKFPLLDELELANCHGIDDPAVFAVVARSCPELKHLKHITYRSSYHDYRITDPGNNREAMAIATMRELRSLQLFRDTLTNAGLAAIVDGCRHLESLDIRSCGNITMDEALQAKCARIKTKTLSPHRSKDRSLLGDFQLGGSISVCSTCMMYDYFMNLRRDNEDGDSLDGYDDYSDCYNYYCYYYLSGFEEADLAEHIKMLGKSMRRYKL